MMKQLYDKNGNVYHLDHEHGGKLYVRPLIKVRYSYGYGQEPMEEEEWETSDHITAIDRSELFDAPPLAILDEEVSAKKAELASIAKEIVTSKRKADSDLSALVRELQYAKRQLDQWTKENQVMIDIGKLLNGHVLYPLSISGNTYHHSRDIPYIPNNSDISYLMLEYGNFEKGQKWSYKRSGFDSYRKPFRFFDTKEERDAAISAEFDIACDDFRKKPNFDTTSYTTDIRLHFGTLLRWVEEHIFLNIPEDIKSMKAAHDVELVEKRKAVLAAELAAINETGAA